MAFRDWNLFVICDLGFVKLMFDILTIGSTTRDTFLRGDFPVVDDPESPGGKAIHANLGEKYEVADAFSTLGGNAANSAVTFARQGLRVGCFAEVGDDTRGKEIKEWLQKERITSLLREDNQKTTAFSIIFLTKEGERAIFAYHGANNEWEAQPPVEQFQAPWWYLSLSGETTRHFMALMEHAREHDIRVAFNPSGYHIRHNRDEILKYLSAVTFLVLNQEEAALLLDMDFKDEKAVFKKLDELVSPGIVAISYGPKGAAISDGKHIIRAGIFPEKQLADRTGAGDAFGSGFVAGLFHQSKGGSGLPLLSLEDLQYAVRLATANATSVVERVGATPGVLTREQFEQDPRWRDLPMSVEEV